MACMYCGTADNHLQELCVEEVNIVVVLVIVMVVCLVV